MRLAQTNNKHVRSEGFSGQLRYFSLVDIIQMACLAQRTGCLQIQPAHDLGRVFLVRGRIVHAVTAQNAGEDALLEMLCWKGGSFNLVDGSIAELEATIHGGWEHVVMEAVRRRDELEHAKPADGPANRNVPTFHLPWTRVLRVTGNCRRGKKRSAGPAFTWSLGLVLTLGCSALAIWCVHPQSHSWWEEARVLVPGWSDQTPAWRLRQSLEVRIPAGEFIFQDGERVTTGAYSMDAAEVTIGQYAAFVDDVGSRTDFDHPNQPKGKGHSNPAWEAYRRAGFTGATYHGQRLTPDVPAAYVDWFDAYAYARWRHRRLPTEAEWEKAGRGPSGFRYPWGDALRPGAANVASSVANVTGPTESAAWPLDRSPYGVYDLAGNVSEWTASFDQEGDPVVKGGNFSSADADLRRRVLHLGLLTQDERLGFRTAGD
ncbi:MAG TPA: SUMF1/EgtB/PvdO family nonheme iron enzyme [Chthoniobacterales bacterium]